MFLPSSFLFFFPSSEEICWILKTTPIRFTVEPHLCLWLPVAGLWRVCVVFNRSRVVVSWHAIPRSHASDHTHTHTPLQWIADSRERCGSEVGVCCCIWWWLCEWLCHQYAWWVASLRKLPPSNPVNVSANRLPFFPSVFPFFYLYSF